MVFSAFSAWSFIFVLALLLFSLLLVEMLKRFIPGLKRALIPTSVLAGIILLIVSTIVYFCAGDYLFNLALFDFGSGEDAYTGMEMLELITYHCLGIGFVAMGMRTNDNKLTKKRTGEVFDSGVTTCSTYLVQAMIGIIVTVIAVEVFNVSGLIDGSGIILCFGFGQGSGQAMNYGNIYEGYGLENGTNFGLTIAALGFLVACICGVVYMNILRRKGTIKVETKEEAKNTLKDYEDENEISITGSLDKFTVQLAIVLAIYGVSYFVMWGLSALLTPIMSNIESIFFGLNFLFGVVLTIPVKAVIKRLEKGKVMKKRILNNFMMNRIGGFAFDLMIVASISAIQLPLLRDHWGVILILAVLGGAGTFAYLYFICKYRFKEYRYEQFFAFFGMLTGTASSGVVLLREIDGQYTTPASENLVYQNLSALVFGLPMMLIAGMDMSSLSTTLTALGIVVVYFAVLVIIIFRLSIFKRFYDRHREKKGGGTGEGSTGETGEDAAEGIVPDASEGASEGVVPEASEGASGGE